MCPGVLGVGRLFFWPGLTFRQPPPPVADKLQFNGRPLEISRDLALSALAVANNICAKVKLN